MGDKLADFMVKLATNDELKQKYKENPQELMEEHDIEADDIKLLLSNKYDLVSKRLGTDYKISFNTLITALRIKS